MGGGGPGAGGVPACGYVDKSPLHIARHLPVVLATGRCSGSPPPLRHLLFKRPTGAINLARRASIQRRVGALFVVQPNDTTPTVPVPVSPRNERLSTLGILGLEGSSESIT